MNALPRTQLLQPSLPENASIKCIGLGGVGGIAVRYVAMFLAAMGRNVRLVMIDGDAFEPSNASRMFFGACGNKAAVIRDALLPHFAESSLSLIAIEEFLTEKNIDRLVREKDFVILTVDNHATRKLVNDRCAGLENVCLFSAGNDGVGADASGSVRRGTYGDVQVFCRRNGVDISPPLTRSHPEIANPADKLPTDLSCTELVASQPQILFANLTAASCLLNTLWLHLCGALHYSELAFDVAEGLMRPTAPLNPTGPSGA